MTRATLTHLGFTGFLLLASAATGAGLAQVHAPLPYMLGSILASALIVVLGQRHFPDGYRFPMGIRSLFVGVVGAMIGASFTPEIAALLPRMAISLPALIFYTLAVHGLNYLIFRRFGGYDPATAYYSGAPGGLFVSILFGEEQGADVVVLTLQQFLRIIIVVTLVPLGMSLWEGHPVGSSAGMSFGPGATSLASVPVVVAIALAGVWLGARLRLPAGQLIGPLVIAAAVSMSGAVTLAPPGWVLAAAQVVIGTGLGIKFTGVTRRVLVRGAALSFVSVTVMMAVGVALAVLVHAISGLPADMLVVSFAPGGVVEMSLIGLSLAANPAFVALHHLVRIFATVGELSVVHRMGWLRR